MSAPGTPRREVVTWTPPAPRAAHGPARPAREVRAHEELPAVDAAVLRALMRRQLRLALATFGLLTAVIGLLPLAFTALPARTPWPGRALIVWAVLGVAAYPALVLIGRWYVVRAERNERDAGDLVERT